MVAIILTQKENNSEKHTAEWDKIWVKSENRNNDWKKYICGNYDNIKEKVQFT